MSESDLSDAPQSTSIPPDSELEQALRSEVRNALKVGNNDPPITVASIRRVAEEALGLEAGFYKKNERWKEESKRIVHEAFNESGADAISPAKPKSVNAKPSVASKERPSKKRPSPSEDSGTVAKKRRKSQPELGPERALSSPPSQAVEEEKPKHAPKPKTNKLTKESSARSKKVIPKRTRDPSPKESESELSDTFDEPPEPANNGEASDSDLSILIDADPPPKKKNRKGSIAAAGKPTKNKSSSTSRPKSETATTDPDLAEIKRLQGWLVKCGVRKLWGKELKPYESPKAKIKHLKDMLADAGMSGRYSIEKASQIKEERELKADIEAVKEGAERWGKKAEDVDGDVDDDGDGDGDARAKPKRRLIRGAQVLDFLDSDEGEETD